MKENTVLAAFILAPVVLLVLLFVFLRKFRRHEKIPLWLRLIAGNSLVFLFLCSIVLVCGEVYYCSLPGEFSQAGVIELR